MSLEGNTYSVHFLLYFPLIFFCNDRLVMVFTYSNHILHEWTVITICMEKRFDGNAL